jgi:lycopene beta-cyclase
MTDYDVLVVGKGPAALAAASAIAARGLTTAVLGPPGRPSWPAEYGVWLDELAAIGLADLALHSWPATTVAYAPADRRVLPRGYARIDKERLLDRLLDRCDAAGVHWRDGAAAEIAHTTRNSLVLRTDGTDESARVVIDATGHAPRLASRPGSPRQGFQTAYGLLLRVPEHPFPNGEAVLMDWSDTHLTPAEQRHQPPSFLYALPFGDHRVFVEETVLVGRPAVPIEQLKHRLHLRLHSLKLTHYQPLQEERCFIPMGGAIPDHDPRVVGFGASAGMVHPATGYLLARTLATAPVLAATLERELGAPDAHPARAATAAWNTLWPADLRARRDLFLFGMEALLRLSPSANRLFFQTFFTIQQNQWEGFLSDRLTAPRLRSTMLHLFRSAPLPVRTTLARTALGPAALHLLRSLLRRQ